MQPPKTSLPCTSPCLLKSPSANLEPPASFFGLSLLSIQGPVTNFTPGKSGGFQPVAEFCYSSRADYDKDAGRMSFEGMTGVGGCAFKMVTHEVGTSIQAVGKGLSSSLCGRLHWAAWVSSRHSSWLPPKQVFQERDQGKAAVSFPPLPQKSYTTISTTWRGDYRGHE